MTPLLASTIPGPFVTTPPLLVTAPPLLVTTSPLLGATPPQFLFTTPPFLVATPPYLVTMHVLFVSDTTPQVLHDADGATHSQQACHTEWHATLDDRTLSTR